MELTAKLVMILREKTALPMMKCKKALEETIGTFRDENLWIDAAIEHLRKQGVDAVNRFAGREITNGGIGMAIGKVNRGALVLLGCQTDFVANSDEFKDFVLNLSIAASALDYTSDADFESIEMNKMTISEHLAEKQAKFGEKINIIKKVVLTGEQVVGYNHGGRIAALVSGTGNPEKLRNIALHITASNPIPISLNRHEIDPKIISKEQEIINSLPEVQAKPEQFRTKIVDGKLNKYLKERVLVEQTMLLDAEKNETVQQYATRNGLTITGFERLEVNI